MRSFLIVLLIAALGFGAWYYLRNTASSEKRALQQENELLQRENELLRKEQALQREKDSLEAMAQKQRDSLEMLKTTPGRLDFLQSYGGKYPYQVAMMENAVLSHRLRTMLGRELDYLKEIWQVQSPIEVRDGFFYTWAMKEHSGGSDAAAIMADLNNDKLYVAIRRNNQAQIYTEDGSTPPTRLTDWAKGGE